MPERTIPGPPEARALAGSCGILSCSPRPGGNCDTAARLFAESYTASCGQVPQTVFLREHPVLPCIACDACRRALERTGGSTPRPDAGLRALFGQSPGEPLSLGCPQAAKDESAALLEFLSLTPSLCLIAPIYFYHLPGPLKCLLDRTQPFWHLRELGISPFRKRPCRIILIGARPRGERLFEGSLISLKFALAGLGFYLEEPLLLYGLDAGNDLAKKEEDCRRVAAYAKQTAASAQRNESAKGETAAQARKDSRRQG